MDRKLVYYIITHYIDMRKLLRSLAIDIRPNRSMLCPFHDNTRTPAAHFYEEEDGSCRIWCYYENKMFSNVDVYKVYKPEINLEELAQKIYNSLSEKEKGKIKDNVNLIYELPELPYTKALTDFKNNKISLDVLLNTINNMTPKDETSNLLDLIYSLGISSAVNINENNKYIYYMNNNDSQYRYILANKLLMTYSNKLPNYLKEYLQYSGDSIMLPNIIKNRVYAITFRNITGTKQFIKLGVSYLFYNLGNLPPDFKYGMPLLITEGNMDCDVGKLIYPYCIATMTNSLSTNQIQLLLGLTNRVIIAYDNDEAGEKGYKNVYYKLREFQFSVKKFIHNSNLKDFGDLIDLKMRDENEYNYIVHSYKIQINNLVEDIS